MPALEALTFDIDLNTSAFEQGAHNVEAILQNLLGGAFHNLALSVENISQNLLGLSGSGAQMSAALSESGQSAVAALTNVSSAGSQMGNALTEGAQQTTTALTETGNAAQQMAALLSQSGGEALESLKALYVDLTQQGQSGAEAMNALMGVITQGGQTNTEVLNALIASLTQTGQSGAEAMEKLTAALTQSGNVGVEFMKSLQDAISRVGVQAQATANQTATFWEATAKRIEFSMRTALRSFIGPMAAVFGISSMFREYTSTADRLGKFAKTFDPTANIEDIQSWGEAAKRSGGSIEGFQMSLRSLNRQLQMGTVSGKKGGGVGGGLGALLKEMKISAKENGKTKDVFRLLTDIAGGAEKMGSGRFAGLAAAARLDQGTIQLLQKGRAEVEKLVERQRALGTYTKEDAKIAADFNDAIADLMQVFKAFAAVIMRTVTPVLSAVAQALTEIFAFFRKHSPLLLGFLSVLAFHIRSKLIPAFIATKVQGLGMIGAIKTAGLSAMAALKASWMSLAAAFVIPVLFEEIAALFDPKTEGALEILFMQLEIWIYDLADIIKSVWEDTIDYLKKEWDAFIEEITAWMPEPVKRFLGLKKKTQEEQKQADITKIAEDLRVKENPADVPEDADKVKDRYARAEQIYNQQQMPTVKIEQKPRALSKEDFENKVQIEWQKRIDEDPNAGIGLDLAALKDEVRKELSAKYQAPPSADETLSMQNLGEALGKLSQIGAGLTVGVSHDASAAVTPVVNQKSEVKIDSDLHLTQNITTNDPQELANNVATPLRRATSDAFGQIVTPWNNGNSIVSTAPAIEVK